MTPAVTARLPLGKSPVDSEVLAQARQEVELAPGRSLGLTEAEGEPRPWRRKTMSWGVRASSRSSAPYPGAPPSVQLSAVGVVCPSSGVLWRLQSLACGGASVSVGCPWGRPPFPALPRLWPQLPCSSTATSGKKQAAKSKEELAQEKKKELERRLQDVSGQLGNSKKPAKRGTRGPGAAPPRGQRAVGGSGQLTWVCACGSTS